MKRLVLDVENTTTKRNDTLHLDPFEPDNLLCMVGILDVDTGDEALLTFYHKEEEHIDFSAYKKVQQQLDECDLLIMHNAQHDLMWLWELQFVYDGDIYDTMLGEYILCRGIKQPLSLDACAVRRKLAVQKQDTLKEYYKKGYGTDEIPHAELSEYLSFDLHVTKDLYLAQLYDYSSVEAQSLHKVRDVTMRVCKTLTRMYMAGIKIDTDALQAVKAQFQQERNEIENRLNEQVRNLMGATPINLNSPEQMSQVLFSRAVLDKATWKDLFNHTKTDTEFKQAVKMNSRVVFKTEAYVCPDCKGQKYIRKTKKDGTPFAKASKCKTCNAEGYLLRNTQEVAGLRFSAPNKGWVSANGFTTSKDMLAILISVAKQNSMKEAEQFLSDMMRLNAVSNYLSTFVGGIENHMKEDSKLLHVSLTQHITSTGRFSGRNPNMQNMPRGGTFPVKKAFISRWEGGSIVEADFAQLEFRMAAFLSGDVLAAQEVKTGFDVHSYTAKVITDAGQPTSRQEAKAHTFAPLYGATGHGRTKAEAAYYHHFIEKYEGIAAWHKNLGDEAIRFNKITTPSGRQYAFPDVYRRRNGSVSDFTRIKNYPVQGFATGDVVPVVLLELERRLKPYQSCIINSVHDSIVFDVHPAETEEVLQIIKDVDAELVQLISTAYDVYLNVPMLLEAKIGPNWLDVKDIA